MPETRDLVAAYRRQFAWRGWPALFAALPPLAGRTVLDLGCGPGDLAAELAAHGARVIGIDLNEELLAAARRRGIPGGEFHRLDLREPLDPLDPAIVPTAADGIWCTFLAAYFPDFGAVLERFAAHLAPGGFISLAEVDDLFGHEPVAGRTRELLDAYAAEALAAGRYDFRMGRRLAGECARAGLRVDRTFELADRELAHAGPVEAEVLAAWRDRLEGMTLLRDFCGGEFDAVREDFLACLAAPDHRTRARVVACVAHKAGGTG